jgi:hypothetical protein
MNETIRKAVNETRVIELRYHDYLRMVEPHVPEGPRVCKIRMLQAIIPHP